MSHQSEELAGPSALVFSQDDSAEAQLITSEEGHPVNSASACLHSDSNDLGVCPCLVIVLRESY